MGPTAGSVSGTGTVSRGNVILHQNSRDAVFVMVCWVTFLILDVSKRDITHSTETHHSAKSLFSSTPGVMKENDVSPGP